LLTTPIKNFKFQSPNAKQIGSFVKKLKNRENTKNIWIPAGVYPCGSRGRNDNLQIVWVVIPVKTGIQKYLLRKYSN